MVKNWFKWLNISLLSFICSFSLVAKVENAVDSHSALFNNLPRVSLLIKEQYVDPARIDPDAMLAAVLESLESHIPRLVVTLPKSMEAALEKARKGESESLLALAQAASSSSSSSSSAAPPQKEKLVLDFGGVKKTYDYQAQKSIWGMSFAARDIFKFVEDEAKKQGLTVKSKLGEEPIKWSEVEASTLNAVLSTLDPHSVYMEPKYARDLTLTTKGEFGGIGIVISIRDGYLTVISPIDGTPAAVAGVKAKDKIIKIDEDSAINMPLEDAVSKLRGSPNTTVKISVQRGNSTKDLEFNLKRDIIKVDSVAYALLKNDIGYLRVKAFQGNTANDVKDAIVKMKKESKGKFKGLILDFRDNPGGLLREAVAISDLFLSEGEIVSTKGSLKESRQVEMATPGELDKNMKIAVLVNGGSASASEIVSAALKYGGVSENGKAPGRAILIGDSATFGKGSVQLLFDFPSLADDKDKGKPVEPAALKLTIAQYYAPQEKIIQTIGVMPDIKINEAKVNKEEELSLFENISMREIDLDAHLLAAKNREEKSLMELSFLGPKESDDVPEYNKLDVKKLSEEFAVKVASEFILSAKGPKRADLLEQSERIKAKLDKEEEKKIADALKKFKIDWSKGEKLSSFKDLKISLSSEPRAKAGEKLNLSLKVKNLGKKPAFQVHAISHSKTPLFDQREFLFGKINPGQEIERTVSLELPKDVVTRKDLLSIELRDVAKEKLQEINLALDIDGLGRPKLAHNIFVDDSKQGNGDGAVQQNEEVELVVWLKNIGDGKAFEPTVLLRNESGSKVFLKTGRVQMGELGVNQEASARFNFRVKEPADLVDFEVQVFDGQMRDIWRDKLSVDVRKKTKLKPKKANFILSAKTASLYKEPSDKAHVIASAKEGLVMESLGEIGSYYLVKADENLIAYVKKAVVKEHAGKNMEAKKASEFYTINYERLPAKVNLAFNGGERWTKKSEGSVGIDIADSSKLSELLLYVNMKKVLYKSLSSSKGNEKLTHNVSLKPGINIISLLAKEDAVYGQRENITVFYDELNRTILMPEKKTVTNQSQALPALSKQ